MASRACDDEGEDSVACSGTHAERWQPVVHGKVLRSERSTSTTSGFDTLQPVIPAETLSAPPCQGICEDKSTPTVLAVVPRLWHRSCQTNLISSVSIRSGHVRTVVFYRTKAGNDYDTGSIRVLRKSHSREANQESHCCTKQLSDPWPKVASASCDGEGGGSTASSSVACSRNHRERWQPVATRKSFQKCKGQHQQPLVSTLCNLWSRPERSLVHPDKGYVKTNHCQSIT